MYINSKSEVKVRLKGIDTTVRDLASISDKMHSNVRMGINDAAKFLMRQIKAKFGVYQPTGGEGNGPWKKLSWVTQFRKMKMYGFKDKPLIASGKMRDSFYVKEGGAGTLSASIASTDPKLIFHIYGTRSRRYATPTYSKKARGYGEEVSHGSGGVPPRDPMLVTAEECRDECSEIIKQVVYDAIS